MAPVTVSAGWLWEMRSAIVARVRDRNPMEVADDLGHGFWRLLSYGRYGSYRVVEPKGPRSRAKLSAAKLPSVR